MTISWDLVQQLVVHLALTLIYNLGWGQAANPNPVGSLPASLTECSGMARLPGGYLAMINDSGNPPELFITDTSGRLVKTIRFDEPQNRDWEALSYHRGRLYIGDIGNNRNKRRDLAIQIFDIDRSGQIPDFHHRGSIDFRYADQPGYPPLPAYRHFDAEALVAHGDSLYIFTKNRSKPFDGFTHCYGLRQEPGVQQARRLGSLKLGRGIRASFWVAEASLHPDGRLLLLSYDKIWLLHDFPELLQRENPAMETYHLDAMKQWEALSWYSPHSVFLAAERNTFSGGALYHIPQRAFRDSISP